MLMTLGSKVFVKNYIRYNDLLILCGINLNLFIIFLDVLMLRKVENLQSSVPVQSLSFNHTIMKWWKSLTRNVAYKLLYIAQQGNVRERLKALCTLNSLKHLKSIYFIISIILYKYLLYF